MNRPHAAQNVQLLTEPDYGFDEKGPKYYVRHTDNLGFAHTDWVDPAPGYHHNVDLVKEGFAKCRERAPLNHPLDVAVLKHEFIGRTNGHYTYSDHYHENENGDYIYEDESKKRYKTDLVGLIILCGKRIPIHPAMTRYLVAHEYGHAVQYALEKTRGLQTDSLKKLYQETIRPEGTFNYGPGKWHTNIGELFANDFRILVMKEEIDFWPHEGYTHPLQTDAAIDWWNATMDELRG